jgi:hypothetical protein
MLEKIYFLLDEADSDEADGIGITSELLQAMDLYRSE